MKTLRTLIATTTLTLLLFSCGGTAEILSTPVENIDSSPLKVSELTKAEKQNWGHLDLVKDTIPGMSVDKAYAEIIKNKKGKSVIVAVIDSGIDIDHEDLDDVIWTNRKEIPNNGKDDDKNGYVDDVHGWNFLGGKDGKLVVAGPFFGNGDLRGLYIFNVKTIEEAEALTNSDPAIQAGSLIMELHPWYGSAALMKVNEIHEMLPRKEF